jgi:hypothetical protein
VRSPGLAVLFRVFSLAGVIVAALPRRRVALTGLASRLESVAR